MNQIQANNSTQKYYNKLGDEQQQQKIVKYKPSYYCTK